MTPGARRRDGRVVPWLLLLLAAAPAAGQVSSELERREKAMQQVVLDQLAAFRRGDWAAAYGYASATIQAQFSPETFRAMVTRGYAQIADSLGATVQRTVADDPQRGYVQVRVHGRDGETVEALYELVDEQGAWKINGVATKLVEKGNLTLAPRLSRTALPG
jgi:Domain of unknown function (DUF4864)